MDLTRKAVTIAALAAAALLAQPGTAPASALKGRAPLAAAKPLPPGQRNAATAPVTRGEKPLLTATSTGAGQAGYVHYFILKLPDESLEIQVGIELADQRIAWSFPGQGVAISPFIEEGVVSAGGQDYEVWYLYGIRPFPDEAAMATLQKELPGRVERWVKAETPYCQHDDGRGHCVSCLGLVLRVLFPGRNSDYPNLPRALARTGAAPGYTPNDLLLFLAGMHDLPTREARLQRLARLTLPDALREDLETLVYATSGTETAQGAAPKPPSARVNTRSTLRRRL
jgi:hypothetical protein